MQPVEVVLGADVVVAALSRVSPAAVRFPAMPPKSPDACTDALAAFVASEGDFALVLTDEIVEQVATVLVDPGGPAWDFDEADRAVDVLVALAGASTGGFVRPAAAVALPRGVGPAAAEALRAAASPSLGFPRVVVTTDRRALAVRTWRPRGVPFPQDEAVAILDPTPFRDLVARVRWELRPG